MNIFITGGTGLVGSALCAALKLRGDQVSVLTRNVEEARAKLGDKIKFVDSLNSLKSLDGIDAVVTLAGQNIAQKRWSQRQKEILQESRFSPTQKLSNLIKASQIPPRVFLSGSAVGYYGPNKGGFLGETAKPKGGFLSELCQNWERLALEASSAQTRVCLLRTGIVISYNGGFLVRVLPLFKSGFGAVMGSGKQYMSWIQLDDMVKAILFLIDNQSANGAFNMCSPVPVTNQMFAQLLGKSLGKKIHFRIPAWILKLILGQMSQIILDSQRAVPQALDGLGFRFDYPTLKKALAVKS